MHGPLLAGAFDLRWLQLRATHKPSFLALSPARRYELAHHHMVCRDLHTGAHILQGFVMPLLCVGNWIGPGTIMLWAACHCLLNDLPACTGCYAGNTEHCIALAGGNGRLRRMATEGGNRIQEAMDVLQPLLSEQDQADLARSV